MGISTYIIHNRNTITHKVHQVSIPPPIRNSGIAEDDIIDAPHTPPAPIITIHIREIIIESGAEFGNGVCRWERRAREGEKGKN